MYASDRKQLAADALKASAGLRRRYGYDASSPISIYDLCEKAGVPVRFVEIDMEGMYIHLGEGMKPTIFLSARRPFHRRAFTCAHELGHHHFGHGMSVDELSTAEGGYDRNEFLVDTFASYLLMPPIGIKAALLKRQLNNQTITAHDCMILASSFGVGYSTFINHLLFNNYLTKAVAEKLLMHSVKALKQDILGEVVPETLFLNDTFFNGKTIDVETTAYIALPKDVNVELSHSVVEYKQLPALNIFRAVKSGLVRVTSAARDWNCYMRIQRANYIGMSQYRHLGE